MFNLKLRNQNHSFFISVHQDNDFNPVNPNHIRTHSNIDIKYRQWFHTLDPGIFKVIREYTYRDHKYHDMDNLLKQFGDFPNQTTGQLPIFRPYFDYQINDELFFNRTSKIPNCRLSKRIELGENINISYDILLTNMNSSQYDVRMNPHLMDVVVRAAKNLKTF